MTVVWQRYAQETRYLLDVVAFAVHQAAPVDRVIGVHAAASELYLDLQDRLGPHYPLVLERGFVSTKPGVIHLLSWESGLSELDLAKVDFVVMAFRNRYSLKTLKYGKEFSQGLGKVVRLLRQADLRVQCWGVYPPGHLVWYEMAHAARFFNRYDLAFYLNDRGDLSPVVQGGWLTRWANYGVVLGVRD
jgi:hypothetical protein